MKMQPTSDQNAVLIMTKPKDLLTGPSLSAQNVMIRNVQLTDMSARDSQLRLSLLLQFKNFQDAKLQISTSTISSYRMKLIDSCNITQFHADHGPNKMQRSRFNINVLACIRNNLEL